MKLFGVILAGGQSRRFGSDKALALLGDKPLIDHVADGLHPQVERLVVAGRSYPKFETISDVPAPGLGPLGGLCGALLRAEAEGFDAVLSAPCDSLPVPDLRQLPVRGGVFANWPLFGRWPAVLGRALQKHLVSQPDRSVFGWIATCGLTEFPPPDGLRNINRPDGL